MTRTCRLFFLAGFVFTAVSANGNDNPITAKFGGIVMESAVGKPEMVILDMRNESDTSDIVADVAADMQEMFRIPVRKTEEDFSGHAPMAIAATLASATNRVVGIVLCEADGLPSLLVAPEQRWAVVNATPLKTDSPTPEVLEQRVRKELWRAAAFAAGAANSSFSLCLMKPVFSLAELDALPVSEISAEPLSSIRQQFQALGIVPLRKSSYKKAVQEGWAPPPTNDVQRAIWKDFKNRQQSAKQK